MSSEKLRNEYQSVILNKIYQSKFLNQMNHSNFISHVQEKNIKSIVNVFEKFKLPIGTAKNTALIENIYTMLVCILNKIPLIIIGPTGCSKTLSLKILIKSMRGEDSNELFFKKNPFIISTPTKEICYQHQKFLWKHL